MTKKHLPRTGIKAELSKLPPQVLEMEVAVLGALLIEKPAIEAIIDLLRPEYFYKPAHQEIYRAILELFAKGQPIDLLTTTRQLRKTDKLELVGGSIYVTELTKYINSASSIEYHARLIVEQAFKRSIIEMTAQIQREAFDEGSDVFELMDRHTRQILELTASGTRSRPVKGADIVYSLLKDLEIEVANPGSIRQQRVFTGFFDFDRITGGLEAAILMILAARPAMGKTSFSLNLVLNAAQIFNKPAAFFSLEMSKEDVSYRFLSMISGIDTKTIKKREMDDEEVQKVRSAQATLSNLHIYIDDTAAITISELTAKLRRLVYNEGIKIAVIDYLQLMRATEKASNNREQEVAQITRALKQLAKELRIPIIALSQINRSVESRSGDKRPQLSDLRESGEIEQSADIVGFLYRADYYGITEDAVGNNTEGITELILAKHRDGETGTILLQFEAKYQRFSNLSNTSFPDQSHPLRALPVADIRLDGFTQNPDEQEAGDDPLDLFAP